MSAQAPSPAQPAADGVRAGLGHHGSGRRWLRLALGLAGATAATAGALGGGSGVRWLALGGVLLLALALLVPARGNSAPPPPAGEPDPDVDSVLDRIDVGVLTVLPEGNGVRLNRAAREALGDLNLGGGPDPHHLRARELGHGREVALDDVAALAATGGHAVELELDGGDEDGPAVPVRLSAPASGPGPGSPLPTFVTVRELASPVPRMDAAEAAAVAHEIRTPLSSVLGHVALLAEDSTLSTGQRDSLRTAAKGVERALRLVNDLMSTESRSRNRPLPLVVDDLDLRALVSDSLKDFGPQATRRQITMSLQAPAAVSLEADPIRIRQVVDNLVSNAVKYNERGGWIDVEIARSRTSAILRVTNPGVPLGADDVASAFEPGYRARAAIDSPIEGSGIGLSVSRDIVTRHGGSIEISSDESSRTTTLTVRLPRKHVPIP